MLKTLSILILSLVLLSCVDKNKVNDFGIGKYIPTSIINNHLLFSSFENESSFPIWFNDSLIRENKITTITRKIYALGKKISEGDSLSVLPIKTVQYHFLKNGQISKVEKTLSHDNQIISTVVITYNRFNEKIGFSSVKNTKNQNSYGDKSSADLIYQIKRTDKLFDHFIEKKSNTNLFVINDEDLWGPFEINKKLQPTPTDRIVLGTMYFPIKTYSVKNTIEESNVEKFVYEKKMISEITSVDLPFQSKRTFQYDRRGYCTSYIDSLFSDEEYLSRTISKFTNNMHFSPIEIVHEKENMNGKKSFHYLELFEYEYRK